MKRLKRARTYDFKRKGNETQHEFNEEVKDQIEAASVHIAKLSQETLEIPDLKAAAKELKEGMRVLHVRQKLICLGNYLDLSWAVIDAYESDKLASDDEDAKWMKEAQKVVDESKLPAVFK